MDYTKLTAKQLQELCRERDLDTARDKATMIERLTEFESRTDAEALSAPETAPEPEPVAPDPKPTPEPTQADPEPSQPDYWVEGGGFSIRVARHGSLDDREHHSNLRAVTERASRAGFTSYGPAFRVNDPDTKTWVYRIWIR